MEHARNRPRDLQRIGVGALGTYGVMSTTVVEMQRSEWDAYDHKDRAILRKLVNDTRWPGIDDDLKLSIVDALRAALKRAREEGNVNQVASIAKTLCAMESVNQKDQHFGLDKLGPKEDQSVRVNLYVIPPKVRKRIDDGQ